MAQRSSHDDPDAQGRQAPLSTADFQALAGFRYALRRLFAESRRAAEAAGLKPQQYQALLALRAHEAGEPMTVRQLADILCIGASTAVELVDRLESRGLVTRTASSLDRRRVALRLTPDADQTLLALTAVHRQELSRQTPTLVALLEQIAPRRDGAGRDD